VSARCHDCGTLIAWVRTVADKRMPIDLEPNPDGNVVIDDHGVAYVLSPKGAHAAGGTRYMPHFATCRNRRPHH
jgi:hypothetical protein